MFCKKLFLESVHQLGLSKAKADTVISLFEATVGQLNDDEFKPEFDENPSDMQDAISGEVDEQTEGSAFDSQGDDDIENKQEIESIIHTLDVMLEPFRTANVHQYHLPRTPNGTRMMVELGDRLNDFNLSGEYHDMRQAMQMMSWEVLQFNQAEKPSEAWKLQFNHVHANTKKYNAITMIRQYMQRIDRNLEIIKEKIGII